jgi:hypothetical protein
MPQIGPSDNRTYQVPTPSGHPEGILDKMVSHPSKLASEVSAGLKERPYMTLAIAGGLAFAVGALWKLNQRSSPSRYKRMLAQMADLPKAQDMPNWLRSQNFQSWLPDSWR